MATQHDVARMAGVNNATVSRVFSGNGPVAPATRQRVMRAAEAVGYRPSAAARATRTGRTGLIGMIESPQPASSVHEPLFRFGVAGHLHALGYKLVQDLIGTDAAHVPDLIREHVVDGVILNYAQGAPPHIRDLLDRCDLPAVWINRKLRVNSVYPADLGAASEATEHLLRHGHRRIAMLNQALKGVEDEHYSTSDRQLGYEQAMHRAGLTARVVPLHRPQEEAVRRSGWLLRACVDVLQQPDRPTALLCNCDGRTVLHAAAVVGVKIPDELSVVAFDNAALSDELVAFDRMLVPYYHMGRAAVQEVVALVENSLIQRAAVAIPFLFYRGNTVAPPGEPPAAL